MTHNQLMHMKRVCARAAARKEPALIVEEARASVRRLLVYLSDDGVPLSALRAAQAEAEVALRQLSIATGDKLMAIERNRALVRLEENLAVRS